MPRIDPKQLLKTLGVLLSNDGGIKSKDEVARLAQLMQKFSKKLVSKCIYVHILKATESSLLEEFLNENGWDLINQWFTDALKNHNLALALEILGLFLVCPMTKELLKANTDANQAPRLINQLRKDPHSSKELRGLANKVYRKWVLILAPHSSNACALRDLPLAAGRSNKIRINNLRKVTTLLDDSENQKPLPKLIIKVPPPKPASAEAGNDFYENGFTSSLIEEREKSPVLTSRIEEPVETLPMEGEESLLSFKEDKTCNDFIPDDLLNKEDATGDQMSGGSLSLLQSLAEEVSDNLKKEDNEEKNSNNNNNIISNNINSKTDVKSEVKSSVVKEGDGLKPEGKKDDSKKSLSPPPSVSSKDEKPKKIKRDRPHHPRDEVNDDQKLHIKAMARKLKEEAQAKKDKDTLKVISGEKMGRIPKIPKKPPPVSEPSEKKEVIKKNVGGTTTTTTKSFSDLLVGLDSKPKTVKTPLNRNKTAALLEGLSTTKPSKASSSSSSSKSSTDSKSKIKDKKDLKQPTFGSLPLKKDTYGTIPKKEALKSIGNGSNEIKSKKVNESSCDPPKPKKDVHNFHESSSFMDAIFSSMGQSDIPRKKKRRLSDKDESSSPKQSKSDSSEKKKSEESKEGSGDTDTSASTPAFSFYRDTLDDEPPVKDESKKNSDKEDSSTLENSSSEAIKETSPNAPLESLDIKKSEDDLPFEEPSNPLPREVKGILVYHRGKEKRNKAISWKPETELTAIRYFELDETERVNVNKLKYDFTNMRKREFELEKAAIKSKGSLEEEVVNKWYKPFPITVDNRSPFKPGESSKEKAIQALREAEVLQAIYFSKENVPDTPAEPDGGELLIPDNSVPPIRIPLDDKEGIPEESVKDFSQGGWPQPKINDVDRESSIENSFSLPPSLSNFLSSIGGNNSIQGIVPPHVSSMSQEEQNTLAAQAQAMQKMGMIVPPPSGPTNEPPFSSQGPLPHPVQHQMRPPMPPHMSEPPPQDHFGGGSHFQQHNGPPPFGPPGNMPMMNNDFHPNNFNPHHHHRHPPPHRMHHPYGGRGFHNGGPRGGGPGRFNNDRQNGFRQKEHHDNRDFRDRSRDHINQQQQQQQPQQHMMGGRRVCKFYAQRGHCRDGERCRFLHENR